MRALAFAVLLAGCHDWDSLSSGGDGGTDLGAQVDAQVVADLECQPSDLAGNVDAGKQMVTLDGGAIATSGWTRRVIAIDVGGGPLGTTDGKLDLVVLQRSASPSTNNLTTLLSEGDGTFSTPIDSAIGMALPNDVVIADFDEDGKPDAVVTLEGQDKLWFMKGNGDGTFAAPMSRDLEQVNVSAPRAPGALAAGYFHDQRHVDLIVAEEGGPRASLFVGAGNGTFTEAGSRPLGVGARHTLLAADVDGDCVTDVVALNGGSGGNTLTILRGMADGALHDFVGGAFTVGGEPAAVAVGDFNRDQRPDLIVANRNSGYLSLVLGGEVGFKSPIAVNVGSPQSAVAAGDFNGDHILDLVLVRGFELALSLGDEAGGFGAPSRLDGADTVDSMIAVDLDGDGLADVAHSRGNASEVYLYRNTSL